MNIESIERNDLKDMLHKEGLILQGCGGPIEDWVDGINKILTESKILLDGDKFEDVKVFNDENITCILFPFEDRKLDIGRFAMWRLQTYADLHGTWLSDYVPNNLGGFNEPKHISADGKFKPDCPLIGQNGNIFNLIAIASRTLKENDMRDEAREMQEKVTSSGSYEEALAVIGEYVNITSVHDYDEDNFNFNF